jgi:hypothetical protein
MDVAVQHVIQLAFSEELGMLRSHRLHLYRILLAIRVHVGALVDFPEGSFINLLADAIFRANIFDAQLLSAHHKIAN